MAERETSAMDPVASIEEQRRLTEKHRKCEERLGELRSRLLLSEEEKLEETNLKKQKLLLKDRMEAIARSLRAASPTGPG